jgi:hypothetical protein
MSRNFGIPSVTARPASGGQLPGEPHHRADTLRDSNSLAGVPPRQSDLSVVRDASFLRQVELNPVQRLNSEVDEREFAACVLFAVLLTVSFGAPLAIAVAFMSFG